MKPIVSFVLINRDGDPFDAAWRAIEAQDLPASQLDVHVLSPVSGQAPEPPTPAGDTVVVLGAPVSPAQDLARLAHECVGEVGDPSRVILQGRALAGDPIKDPISRRMIEGHWSDYARVTDPDNLPFHWLDTRCLVMTRSLFTEIAHALVTHGFDPDATRTRLGHALAHTHDISLRVRPRLRVIETGTVSVDQMLGAVRNENLARFELAASSPGLASALAIPSRESVLEEDPRALHDRFERLGAIAAELAKIDLPRLHESAPTKIPAAATIERLADDVLRQAHDVVARITWYNAARRAGATPANPAPMRAAVSETPAATAPAETPSLKLVAGDAAPPAPAADEPPATPAEPPSEQPSLQLTPGVAATPPPAEEPSLQLTPGGEIPHETPSAAPEAPEQQQAPRARDDVPDGPDLSIVVVATDAAQTLPECLAAIDKHTAPSHEILVVDNGSRDGTAALARSYDSVQMVVPLTESVGFGEAANLALRVARGRSVVLLEPEAVPGPNWAQALLAGISPGVGAVGPISNGLAGAQSLVRWLGRFTVLDDVTALVTSLAEEAASRESAAHPTRALRPLCVLVPRQVLTEIGPLSDQLETADAVMLELALRIHRGGMSLAIATDAFVARSGGLRRSLLAGTASDASPADAAAARKDVEVLRGLVRTGARVPAAREIWDVDIPGFEDGQEGPRVSVVIPVCNQLDFTKACLDSLRSGSSSDVEIVVVDNGSTDGTAEYLAQRGDVLTIRNPRNRGFSPAVNQGLARAVGREILVLNNDVIVPHRMLERLVRTLDENPDYDLIGPVTNVSAPSQQIPAQYEDVEDLDAFSDTRWESFGTKIRPEPVVLGLAMLMRRELLETVGGFDERFEVGNFEDNDFSLRATVGGHRLGVADGVYIHHFGGRTFAGEGFDYAALMRTNHARFLEKWQGSSPAASAPAEAPEPVDTPAIEPDPSLATPDYVDAPGWLPLDAAAHGAGEAGGAPRQEPPGRWAERAPGEAPPSDSAPTPETVPAPANGHPAPSESAGRNLAPGDIYLVANDRLEKGLFAEAAELFEWAIEQMPEMVLAHMGHGLALARLGRLEEAASALEHTVRLEPSLSEAFNNLGVVYYMMGRLDHAQRALERGVELDPENPEARGNLEEIGVRLAAADDASTRASA